MGLRTEQAETYAGRAGSLLIIVSAPAVVYEITKPIRRSRALACSRRRNDVTRCNDTDSLRMIHYVRYMTSSIKPEVHNVTSTPSEED